MPRAYYNEIDSYAAQWLRNLIKAGHIAPGDVDERSIVEVTAKDLKGYTQCHFFAGIGVWSHALRQAGWEDAREVWTGSCPCQPFSVAGRGKGTKDERHLWPEFYRLIRECKPHTIFGEQVSSKDGLAWFDVVSLDLERSGYAVGALDTCAAGVGAPHIRQRLYFVADAAGERWREKCSDIGRGGGGGGGGGGEERVEQRSECGGTGGMGITSGERCDRVDTLLRPESSRGRRAPEVLETSRAGAACIVGDARISGARRDTGAVSGEEEEAQSEGGIPGGCVVDGAVSASAASLLGHAHDQGSQVRSITHDGQRALRIEGPAAREAGVVGGFWADADLIWCRDEKYRTVEPGAFPLAHGATNRVGKLRAYGNSLVAAQAVEFVKSYLDAVDSVDGEETALAQEG